MSSAEKSETAAYNVVVDWERLPADMAHLDVADVAVDSQDNVYLLTRRDSRVLVYDRFGVYLNSWGENLLSSLPHGITIGPSDIVYIADELLNSVEAYSLNGAHLFKVGPDGPSDTGADPTIPDIYDRVASIQRSAGPYNRPTKLAVAPSGELFVTDGYGNARVHRFTSEGAHIQSWGEPGLESGQFHLPHGLAVLPDERVVVCDRENNRLQVFTPDGKVLEVWPGFQRPTAVFYHDDSLFVTEAGWRTGQRTWTHGVIGQDTRALLSVVETNGEVRQRWGNSSPCSVGGLTVPHGVCVDGFGDVYIAEVTWNGGGKNGLYPTGCHTFVKLSATTMSPVT